MKTNQENTARKRLPDTISIESPIMVKLEIEKEKGKLIAVLTFANTGEQDVIIDKGKMGGEKLREEIFYLKPAPVIPNLTFDPYKSIFKSSLKYIVMKPQEVIVTRTELTKYYNLKEKKYDSLYIIYSTKMMYLDKNYKQIYKIEDARNKPVVFYVYSANINLTYQKLMEIIK